MSGNMKCSRSWVMGVQLLLCVKLGDGSAAVSVREVR